MSLPEAPEYGFYGRLRSEFPSQVLVDATEICNLACVHCPHPDFARSEHYGGRAVDPELNRKMVDEVRDHGQGITQYIRYASNGEPLVHPAIWEMMEDAARRSGVPVTLTTNGRLLDEKRGARLLESGVQIVDVSLDALSDETYARIRVGGSLPVTRGNVLNLIRKRAGSKSPLKVVVSYVEQPANQHETQGFEQFWKDEGADYVVIRRLHSCSGAKTALAEERRVEQSGEARRPCLYPWERIVLNAMGQLSFCPSDWVHGSLVAEYRSTTILETWRGPFYEALRKAHRENDFAAHPFCGQCPDWESTRWPSQGRSYADMVQDFKDSE
jgi:MoaA/NifB/PqqE/SkfB family radical SAM enzyme